MSFAACYPDVQPDVQLDDRIGNWVEDRVDVGFRVGASPAEGVIARKLFPLQLIICAAPAYLARYGAPDSLDALAAHRCSVFRHPGTGKVMPWYVKVGDGIVEHHVVPALCVNDEALETEAVLAGHVIGLLTGVTAAPHIRSGRLVPLLTRARRRPARASSSTTAAAPRSRRVCGPSSTWRSKRLVGQRCLRADREGTAVRGGEGAEISPSAVKQLRVLTVWHQRSIVMRGRQEVARSADAEFPQSRFGSDSSSALSAAANAKRDCSLAS